MTRCGRQDACHPSFSKDTGSMKTFQLSPATTPIVYRLSPFIIVLKTRKENSSYAPITSILARCPTTLPLVSTDAYHSSRLARSNQRVLARLPLRGCPQRPLPLH